MIYGAIIGDVIGSRYEIYTTKDKNFELFPEKSTFTDDTVMTIAVAFALIRYKGIKKADKNLREMFINEMQRFGKKHPKAGFGMSFREWIYNPKPLNSYGNGSAMRVSPCGLAADSLEEALFFAEESALVSHNHPEGIKGAKAVAACVYLAKIGKSKKDILNYIDENFYPLKSYPSIDEIRARYKFRTSCRESVPEAIISFLESVSFEDAIRNAVSLGGDADTQAAIAGSIAAAYYNREKKSDDYLKLKEKTLSYLPESFIKISDSFNRIFGT